MARTASPNLPPLKMLIGANWVDGTGGQSIDVRDPATEDVFAHVPRGNAEDINRAVGAARAAFEDPAWRGMRPLDRGRLLENLARLLEEHAKELATLESLDNGKPIHHAELIDLPATIDVVRYMAGWCSKIAGQTFPISGDGRPYHAYSRREPIGVVGAIVPWNYPLAMAAWKVAPALAVGCAVVLKPSEETPLTALRLGELALEAGFPPGVLNIVTGYGHEAGAALAAHAGVDKVAFTGSTEAGKSIIAASAGNLKRVSLELGGKSPSVVLSDADLTVAIPGAATAIFFNSGQVCFAGSRLLATYDVYDKVVAGVAEIAKGMPVGSGRDPDTLIGPLVSKGQQDRVCGYIEAGRAEGAEVVAGGGCCGPRGYFVEPTVLARTTPDMKVVREEIFGPVVTAMPVRDVAEAVALANDTRYGLAASIWTRDLAAAHRLAGSIQAGTVWVNCHGMVDPAMPFGGLKESGWGREVAEDGIHLYTETKSVCIALGDA